MSSRPDARDAYDRWHLEHTGESDPTPTAAWHEMAKKQLGDIRGLRVLEIGCGPGAFARYLVEQGADVTAADFSPAAVELTDGLIAGRGRSLVADIQNIPFEDESFDLVVSLETLEHVPDPDRGLAELVRVTRRGGRLIVTTPNYLSLIGLYRVYLRLTGRTFSEAGQPINQPLVLVDRVRKLKRLGCRVDAVDGTVHLLPIPRYHAVQLQFLEHPRRLTKWFALHGLTAATRLS
ncbi:MAG: class I SAM-dependent methyltransferase [Actinomycetota bacterium]